jgi:diaminohydroxyphosphoribosylaminopyrimidine deaminase/5-amino-6-(5-phosphoribosylamino)uracil reductase
MPLGEADEGFMREALALAMRGRGRVEPNPMVGCVIVKDGRVIGRGYHERYGSPHAEPNALASCAEDPAGATAYVTLEPCCHTNKQTPPCVPKLIAAKLARVVIGCADPNPNVSGKGIAQLREAGVEVREKCLEAEAKQLAAPFFSTIVRKRPYVTLKWAETSDHIVGQTDRRMQISNPTAMQVVHELRSRCDAILVGVNTVIADDPMLTVRGVEPMRPLLRVALDRNLSIPLDSRLIRTARETPLMVFCRASALATRADRAKAIRSAGATIAPLPEDASLDQSLAHLGSLGLTHLLVEPGPTLASSFLRTGLADRVWIIESPKSGGSGLVAAPVAYPPTEQANLAGDVLTEYLNPGSEVYFALKPSVDLLLAARH